jgi:hypothetical protein
MCGAKDRKAALVGVVFEVDQSNGRLVMKICQEPLLTQGEPIVSVERSDDASATRGFDWRSQVIEKRKTSFGGKSTAFRRALPTQLRRYAAHHFQFDCSLP